MSPAAPDSRLLHRLQKKIRILEGMLEDHSREDYLQAQYRTGINALLQLSKRDGPETELLSAALDILLAQEFLAIENRGCIFLAQPEAGMLRLAAHQNYAQPLLDSCHLIAYGDCLCGQCAATAEVIIADSRDDRHRPCPADQQRHGHYCAPLAMGMNLFGVLCLHLPAGMQLTTGQREFLTTAADIITGILHQHQVAEELAHYQRNLEEMVESKVNELRTAENRFRDLFNHSPDGIFQTTADGQLLTGNPAMARILGYADYTALAQAVTTIQGLYLNPEDHQRLLTLAQQGPVTDFETRLRRADGSPIWVRLTARRRQEGEDILVDGNLQDISRRKTAEQALATEKERLAVTLRSIGDGVIATDRQGRVVLCNKVAEKLTGWSQQEATGRPLHEVFQIINERTGEPCVNPVDKVLTDGVTVALANHTALIARDGSRRSIADSGAPIRDRQSNIVGVVLVFRDVTEEHRVAEELRQKRQVESLGLLAGGIAHDFNNLLTAVLGNLSLAEMLLSAEQQPRFARLLAQAAHGTKQAATLVRQLLTFTKGQLPVRQNAAIDELITATTDFALRGSGVAVRYDFAPDLQPADIDIGQISQVVQNLVLNAKQAMTSGGTLTIGCRNFTKSATDSLPLTNGSYLQLSFTDQGCGIAASALERIFTPYFTTKEGGNGLGLAIVHSIVSKHNGHITVASEPGQGTTFTLYLPAASGPIARRRQPEDTAIQLGHGPVLLMDDDDLVAEAMTAMLEALGYRPTRVKDGAEALAVWQQAAADGTPFEAAIMDLTIPGGMGGKEAVSKLRNLDPTAKVLAASGYASDPIIAEPEQYGFAASLAKPFQIRDLARVLAAVTGERG